MALTNADNWMYYAMGQYKTPEKSLRLTIAAVYANQNAWVLGYAQELDKWGPGGNQPVKFRRVVKCINTDASVVTEAVMSEAGPTVAPALVTSALAAEFATMNLSAVDTAHFTSVPATPGGSGSLTATAVNSGSSFMATTTATPEAIPSCEHQDETVSILHPLDR